MKKFIAVLMMTVLTAAPAFAAAKGKARKTGKSVAAATVAPPSSADEKNKSDFAAAEKMLYGQRPKTALIELTRLCDDESFLRACSLLGFGYYSGRYGIARNTQTAIEWYEKCADKEKNFFCHKELARIYYRAGDYDKAFAYYKKAAVGGDADGQYGLAKMYLDGKSVHADYEKSLRWMRKAAHARKNPSKAARCALVEMSYFGIGMRRSLKDTKYWLRLCETPLVRALMSFYGHGVPRDRQKAREILVSADLRETLADWNDLTGQSLPSVGKKNVRDQNIAEDCLKSKPFFETTRKTPDIATYAVKIFNPDFYRSFDVHDGYVEKAGIGDQTFEACGITFYTTAERKRLLNKALKDRNVIKISRYTNACLGAETTGVCDLNLTWREEDTEE